MEKIMSNKNRTVLERVVDVENEASELNNKFDGLTNQVRNGLEVQGDFIKAIIEVAKGFMPDFESKFEAVFEANQKAKIDKRIEREKAQLDQLLKSGALKVSKKVTGRSLLAVRFFEKDGTAGPRQQVLMNQFIPELQSKLLDQGVGFTSELENGVKVELLELYEIVEQTPPVAETPDAAPVGQ